MKTIAHILPFPAVGGTEHATLRIAKAIDPARFRSVAFCLAEADSVRQLFDKAGIQTVTYEPPQPSYRHAGSFLHQSKSLAGLIRRERVDLMHCADVLAAIQTSWAGRIAGTPVLCHVRNRFDTLSRRDCSFLWPVRRFIFVSRTTWQVFACRVRGARGTVVYDGIDIPSESAARLDRVEVRKEFDIPDDVPLIGMMARVAPQKDYPTLAKAAARVLQRVPTARFLVAGDHSSGPENREHYGLVRQVLRDEGVDRAFIFTGQRQDVGKLLNGIDIFALSTHSEGLPLVILEAMAHRLAVVATAVDGVPEIVRDGETGLLFPHQDYVRFAEHLIRLIEQPAERRRLAENGRQIVRQHFTREQFGAGMNGVYESALDERRRS